MKCFFQLCAMTQVKITKPSGLPRASIFIRQSNGRHRGRAQGGGGAQTWSDASCITLTLEHWEPALHQLFNHFVRPPSCHLAFNIATTSLVFRSFVLVCLAVCGAKLGWGGLWVGGVS